MQPASGSATTAAAIRTFRILWFHLFDRIAVRIAQTIAIQAAPSARALTFTSA
jgi:hypothetical protein